jgi:hypothetical protein
MRVLPILALCVAASAAACNTSIPQIGSNQTAGLAPDSVRGSPVPIGDMGTVPVIVFGSAFGLDRGMLEQTIANDMDAASPANARFVPSSAIAQTDAPDFSVIMLINAPQDAVPADYCSVTPPADMSGPVQRFGGFWDIEVTAVLCQNGLDVREVRTSANGLNSLDDPDFHQMVVRTASGLTETGGGAAASAGGSRGGAR